MAPAFGPVRQLLSIFPAGRAKSGRRRASLPDLGRSETGFSTDSWPVPKVNDPWHAHRLLSAFALFKFQVSRLINFLECHLSRPNKARFSPGHASQGRHRHGAEAL